MTFERFRQVLREHSLRDDFIQRLWDARPTDNLNEASLRIAASIIAVSRPEVAIDKAEA